MPDRCRLPLFAWREEQRRGRAAARLRARRIAVRIALGTAALAALAALCATLVWPPAPRLVWNASASAPIGLYRITPGARPRRGDYALVRLPRAWRLYAARRGYLPANVPAIKRVAALSGETICANAKAVEIGGAVRAPRRSADAYERPLPAWSGCRVLRPDEVFLLNDAPGSFDGRYFGAVDLSALLGKAQLLWAP